MRYMPPKGTDGLLRSRVSGYRRSPCPPASTIDSVSSKMILRPGTRLPRRVTLPQIPSILEHEADPERQVHVRRGARRVLAGGEHPLLHGSGDLPGRGSVDDRG